ncbi:hypothetical protein [Pedobacter metabolipauper]|uniref:Uncharacterized protein n=1 Tax=Pedobacter metabolipauper TaxID=425513 RepID=A0A4R6SZI6_9SPHI|nr:hypothetical protein [Pedobacter metabolipauper]TDQ11502.1 hypothetical protein ATK78_0625 [Pedobacter metabolipauper]
MNILKQIKNLFTGASPAKAVSCNFIFPYATDPEVKRKQIWENLQKGLLFEDTGVLIPWTATYMEIHRIAVKRRDSGDRTNYFLGEHNILDGFHSFVGVMKWADKKSNEPFMYTDEYLGTDDVGNEKFLMLKDKLTALLGTPNRIDLEKFGHNDIGSIEWQQGEIIISLTGIEQFACKYRMYIGLDAD